MQASKHVLYTQAHSYAEASAILSIFKLLTKTKYHNKKEEPGSNTVFIFLFFSEGNALCCFLIRSKTRAVIMNGTVAVG